MRKTVMALVMLLALCFACMPAKAEQAVICSDNQGAVHLRAGRSVNAASRGLYFPGVTVQCEGEPLGEWVHVIIGTEMGYMKADYLLQGNTASTALTKKYGTVRYPGALLMKQPSDAAEAQEYLDGGATLMLLGETKDNWYYVQVNGGRGYVAASQVQGMDAGYGSLPFVEETHWYLSSGAGAWDTHLVIQPDGSFTGEYEDWDMGDTGRGYPDGTRYSCRFWGQLSAAGAYSEGISYAMVTGLWMERTPGEVRYVDGVREIASAPHGIARGDQMMLCLSGTGQEWLGGDTYRWVQAYLSGGRLTSPVLVNQNQSMAFCLQ